MKRLLAAPALAMLIGSATVAVAADHPHGIAFVRNAIEGDNSEITLGRIAERRGGSAPVRAYGAMLVKDHTAAKAKAVALARRLHSYAPQSMIGMAIAEEPRLQKLSGADFDREFTRYMAKDHKEDVADFQAEATSADNPQITAFAKASLPTLRKHLAVAEKLSGGG